MVFSHQFLDEVKMRVSLSDIVGNRVKLVKKGREFLGLCPFHNEKTPSFTINEEKGFYHCFGCQAHGSVIDFIMETENLNFRETIEKLASLAGIEIPKDSRQQTAQNQIYGSLMNLMEEATSFFQESLMASAGNNAREYLNTRGLDHKTITNFRLGYAPYSRNALKSFLQKSGYSEKLMLLGGLLIKPNSKSSQTSYDRFRDRIIFPINNRQGKTIAFGARALGNGKPKYLNSSETPIYQKGNELFGLSHALPTARKEGFILVTEGYMDVIALHKCGFQNSVAPLGTALTESQMKLLWKTVSEPILCFDGDTAGERAAVRVATRALALLSPGNTIRFASLPSGEDPDSLIKSKGHDAMKDVIKNSVPLSQFLWELESLGGIIPETPEERASLQKRLTEYAHLIQNPTMRGYFINFFKTCISKQPNYKNNTYQRGKFLNKTRWAPNIQLRKEAGPNAKVDVNFLRYSILLAALINHPKSYDHLGERLGTITCSPSELDKLRQEVLKICEDHDKIGSEILKNHLENVGQADTLARVLSEEVLGHAYFIREGTPLEEVKIGWDEVFNQIKARDLIAEIEIAEKKFADQPNIDTWNRLVALREQEIAGKPSG